MMKLYNTLTRKKEEFKPLIDKEVGLYTCGPTVYNYAHIGNLRAYIFEDVLRRILTYSGYKVKHVMNITDVGHLTGDMDMGEDKLEKGAKREGKTAWEVAKFYELAFVEDMKKLNLLMPDKWTRATEYIDEQIELIKILEEKGFTYTISDGVYYDTSKFDNYNKLSHLDLETLQEGARVEKNDEKKNPTDFALWKFSPKDSKRDMEWESPWGTGFPGWHLECSAMSQAELGDQLDIHCGGIDHINVHHTNEIAQSEAAYDKEFFHTWIHGAFLNIKGGKKMAKSDDNFLTLENAFEKKSISPLVYRFATLQISYRKPMEYSEESIKNAEKGLEHLKNQVRALGDAQGSISEEYQTKFREAINDDMNMPQAMAIVQEVLKSEIPSEDKLATVLDFDLVLGLGLDASDNQRVLNVDIEGDTFSITTYIEKGFGSIAEEEEARVSEIANLRIMARRNKDWAESDKLRDQLNGMGYVVDDTSSGSVLTKK